MKEPIDNVAAICPECAEDRLKSFQERNPGLVLYPGDFVKIAFHQNELKEHMWVRIVKRTSKSSVYHGTLNNDPLLIEGIKDGDAVSVKISEVQELIRKNK